MRELQKIITLNKTQFKITDSITNEMGVCIPCIYGKLSEVEVISPNGYRYPSNFWNKVLRSDIVQNAIANRDMLGMIEHP